MSPVNQALCFKLKSVLNSNKPRSDATGDCKSAGIWWIHVFSHVKPLTRKLISTVCPNVTIIKLCGLLFRANVWLHSSSSITLLLHWLGFWHHNEVTSIAFPKQPWSFFPCWHHYSFSLSSLFFLFLLYISVSYHFITSSHRLHLSVSALLTHPCSFSALSTPLLFSACDGQLGDAVRVTTCLSCKKIGEWHWAGSNN